MSHKVRVRFAPSPTGPLHIGGVRTALFNFLFAKKHGGEFILRIEDTDQNRFVEGAEQYIIEALQWCGIPYDEGPGKEKGVGPYRQSERKHLYQEFALDLVKMGKAYYAFDTNAQLDFHRKEHEAQGKTFIYNWHNRLKLMNSLAMSPGEVTKKLAENADYVIRFLTPQDEKLHLKDLIRGDIEIDTNQLDDKVLFKSDGMPTYHLANIVDDHLMKITHVIRGEEWLPSLALHQQLYMAFDWKAPEFAHLPLILKPAGNGKLSKRDGEKLGFPVFPLSWNESIGYRESGYFPEAVINFLALLGWNPGTEKEFFSLDELIEAFSLERVHKSGARFDPDKTKWYNQHYLQQKTAAELAGLFMPIVLDKVPGFDQNRASYIEAVISLIKERATFVSDLWELGAYFFEAPKAYDTIAAKKHWKEGSAEIMQQLALRLEDCDTYTPQIIESIINEFISDQDLSYGKVMPPMRLVIVGEMKGPHLFDIMALIGKAETLLRIQNAVAFIR